MNDIVSDPERGQVLVWIVTKYCRLDKILHDNILRDIHMINKTFGWEMDQDAEMSSDTTDSSLSPQEDPELAETNISSRSVADPESSATHDDKSTPGLEKNNISHPQSKGNECSGQADNSGPIPEAATQRPSQRYKTQPSPKTSNQAQDNNNQSRPRPGSARISNRRKDHNSVITNSVAPNNSPPEALTESDRALLQKYTEGLTPIELLTWYRAQGGLLQSERDLMSHVDRLKQDHEWFLLYSDLMNQKKQGRTVGEIHEYHKEIGGNLELKAFQEWLEKIDAECKANTLGRSTVLKRDLR